ncbi:MAG: leucine-rich repeat domain-containing protein, partial [Clostridia bacterium]
MAYSDNQSLINQLYNNGQDVTLYAVFTAVEYKVEFYSGLGATGSQAGIGTKHIGDTFALPTCTYTAPANKRFSSWSDGTTTYLVGAIFTMPASDVAFTAMWEVDTYSVSFDVTGATSSNAPLPQQKNEGDTITIPYGIYKDDNAFCGWNDGAKTYAVGDVYTMPAKSVIFTAVWKQATVGLVYTSISADTAYSVKGDSATIGSALDVVIPSSHLGKPVTMVATSGFNGSNSAIYKTLTSIHIGYGVTTIGQEAFYRCDGVTSIDIPKTVNDIGREAFSYCARLLAITIPEGVTQLRFNVLSDCYSLSAVSIPSSVTMINRTALDWCGQLTTITVASGNTFYKVVSGCLISLQDVVMEDDIYETVTKGTLIRGTLNSVIPTDGALVNRIGYTAFRYSGIQSIVIPSNITILESYCFNYAESLTSVILHEGLTTIGSQAFSKCTALTSIII